MLVAVSACGSQGAREAESPAEPQDELLLAVTRSVVGNPPRDDIVLLTANGRVVRQLVSGSHFSVVGGGTWSPDGRRFAFAGSLGRPSFEDDEKTDIFVVDDAGLEPRRLTESGRAAAPVWSPDGRTIVFAEFARGRRFPPTATLWSIAVDGTRKRRLLAPERGRADVPSSFSPDGSQLAITRQEGFEVDEEGRVANTAAIYLVEMRSLDTRKLVERASDAAFSPDGRRIAYVTDRDENGELAYGDFVSYANELYVMEVERGETRRLTKTADRNEATPSWSPDGGLIAYGRGEVVDNAEGTVVLTARADGTCPRRIAFAPGLDAWYTSPVWRPGDPRSDAHLRCKREPEPQPFPLAGNMSLRGARDFRAFRLYWLGPRFREFFLSSISRIPSSGPRGRGARVDLYYGNVQLQLSHACVSVPADTDLPPQRRMRIRGVEVFFYDLGHAELVAGTTAITIFAEDERSLLEVIRALRPIEVDSQPALGDDLPPPAPGALAGELRC